MTAAAASGFYPRVLRDAFGHYATGVVVVTTRSPAGEATGVTVNSFTSVSLEPPLVMFCLLNRANNYATWEHAEYFTMNILTERQQAVSNAFARPSANPWAGIDHGPGDNGCALLHGAAVSLECSRFAHYPGGDHLIIVGRVTRVHANDAAAPLVFHRGKYGAYWRGDFGAPPADSTLSDMVMAGFG
ncbi:MAG TPA: flavin reductase family protein [Ramlibacter sp.]|nr:flavin reductase family protein [Ramlibacter sp.]